MNLDQTDLHGDLYLFDDRVELSWEYREILHAVPDGILMLDTDRSQILAVNQIFLDLLGMNSVEVFADCPGALHLIEPCHHTTFLELGEPGMEKRELELIELRTPRGPLAAEVSARFSVDAVGVARWLYFFREARSGAGRLADDVSAQKRITSEAVKTAMQVYYLADKIRSAPTLSTRLFGALDETTLLERACQFLCAEDGFNCRTVSVALIEDDELRVAYCSEPDGEESQTARLDRLRAFHTDGAPPPDPAMTLLPLHDGDRALGILELQFDPRERELLAENEEVEEWHSDLLVTVSEMLVLFLLNARLNRELRNLTIRDSGTGLFNRRYLMSKLSSELKRAQRFVRDLSVLFIDLDGFKQINDDHGHDAGDRVLRELASILGSVVRDSDVVCRYGGDEFVIIMPETDALSARVKGEELRRQVERHQFLADQGLPERVPLTLSIGVASSSDSSDPQSLLQLADHALYEAKREGRNRVVKRGS